MNARTILLLIITLGGCSKPTTMPPTIPKPVVLKPNRFPRPEEKKRELLAKIPAVKKGDKIEKVVEVIGHGFSTEPYELEDINQGYGTKVIYFIPEPHGVYEDIVFWFGNDDRLVKVTNTIAEGPGSPPEKRHTKEIDLESGWYPNYD